MRKSAIIAVKEGDRLYLTRISEHSMYYVLLNTTRVLICYAVMILFSAWHYEGLFTYERVKSASIFYLFAFCPFQNCRLLSRVAIITLSVFLVMFTFIVNYYVSNSQVEFQDVMDFALLLSVLSWLNLHYAVFVLVYVLLEHFFMKRFAAAPATMPHDRSRTGA